MRKIGIWILMILIAAGAGSVSCKADENGTVFCEESFVRPYKEVLPVMLPEAQIRINIGSVFAYVQKGAACEASDVLAEPMVQNGIAEYWYPQYQATVVIAADREKTDAVISGWESLDRIEEPVGFLSDGHAEAQLLCGISAGLPDEGEEKGASYITKNAVSLLTELRRENRFSDCDEEAPVLICFDYQAAALKKQGRKIEIIIPEEGTRTYQKGLVTDRELTFAENLPDLLVSAGLRLPDGSADPMLYPDDAEYQKAWPVTDFKKYAEDTEDINQIMFRKIKGIRLYCSADGMEHQMFAAVFMVLLLFWSGVFIRRILQPKLRRLLLSASGMMGGWVFVRFVKYQLIQSGWLVRYAWYAYYIFMLGIPLVILWFMLETDGKETIRVPVKVRKAALAVYLILLGIVFTNDLHMQVFRMNLPGTLRKYVYQYGPVYWIIIILIILMLVISVLILIIKAQRMPRKGGHVVLILFFLLFLGYGIGYIRRVPFIWNSDFTMMAGITYILFFETAMQAGLIQINKEYGRIFVRSSLKMQIFDKNGSLWMASGNGQEQLNQPEGILLCTAPITGGKVLWQEDISEVRRLQNQIQENVRFIRRSNEFLAKERELKAKRFGTEKKLEILEDLEKEIHDKMSRLSAMIEALPEQENQQLAVGKITLLLCYIKRRCNLFFREREQEAFPAEDLKFFLEELTEFAEYAGIRYLPACSMTCNITPEQAILFYDLVHEVLMICSEQKGSTVLLMMQMEGREPVIKILPSIRIKKEMLSEGIRRKTADSGGKLQFKELDEMAGISLAFPAEKEVRP